MHYNSTYILLTNTMMIGVIMTICSNNWLSMWIGLEVSLMSFIPMLQNNKLNSSESMMKYFIMQSAASTLFLLSVVIMLVGDSMMDEIMMTISMLIKIGLAPFHNWVIMVIEHIDFNAILIMSTIMKIQPIYIMFQINSKMLTLSILLSMVLSSTLCLNQSSIKKTLGYSSIYNSGVMMMAVNKINVMLSYMMIYSIILILLMKVINQKKVKFINQMTFNEFNPIMKVNMWINMLSMSGFPMTIGFLGKMMIIELMMSQKMFLMMMAMLSTSMLVSMFYMRMTFSSMLMVSSLKKWSVYDNKSTMFILLCNLTFTPALMSLSSFA